MRTDRRLARWAALAAAAALVACSAGPGAEAGPVEVRTLPFQTSVPEGSRLRLLSAIELRSGAAGFGGLSALEVSADGTRIVAMSDQATWFEARLVREGGRLVGVADARLRPMLHDGRRPPLRDRDSEGLAIAAPDLSGPRMVGFERRKRIERMEGPDAEGATLVQPPAWDAYGSNTGPEALAAAPDGRTLAIIEAPRPDGATFEAAWISPDGALAGTRVPRLLPMSATGADFDAQGRLWLLMREFAPLGGFRFAIVRFRPEGDGFADGEVMLEMPFGPGSDNAEGIAAWTDPQGRTRLLAITDDNFNMLQKTVIYEYVSPD